MKLPAASSGVSFCVQKSISWQATGEFNPRKRLKKRNSVWCWGRRAAVQVLLILTLLYSNAKL